MGLLNPRAFPGIPVVTMVALRAVLTQMPVILVMAAAA